MQPLFSGYFKKTPKCAHCVTPGEQGSGAGGTGLLGDLVVNRRPLLLRGKGP